jgi:hypothetical protein
MTTEAQASAGAKQFGVVYYGIDGVCIFSEVCPTMEAAEDTMRVTRQYNPDNYVGGFVVEVSGAWFDGDD